MASRALLQLEPEVMRLYAFTLEAVTNELEKHLPDAVRLASAVGDVSLTPGEGETPADFQTRLKAVILAKLQQSFDGSPTISGRPAGNILRDLAANMRMGADKAEAEFTSRQSGREERKTRREQRRAQPGGSRQGFAGEDFPGASAFFGNAGFTGAGGGQEAPSAPGVPPMSSAMPAQAPTSPGVPPPPDPGLQVNGQAAHVNIDGSVAPNREVPVAERDFTDDSLG